MRSIDLLELRKVIKFKKYKQWSMIIKFQLLYIATMTYPRSVGLTAKLKINISRYTSVSLLRWDIIRWIKWLIIYLTYLIKLFFLGNSRPSKRNLEKK